MSLLCIWAANQKRVCNLSNKDTQRKEKLTYLTFHQHLWPRNLVALDSSTMMPNPYHCKSRIGLHGPRPPINTPSSMTQVELHPYEATHGNTRVTYLWHGASATIIVFANSF
jgi:hypothetical protein